MTDQRQAWLTPDRAMLPLRVMGPPLARVGSTAGLLGAPPGQLGLKEANLAQLRQAMGEAAANDEALRKCGPALLARADPAYPPLLREIHDPAPPTSSPSTSPSTPSAWRSCKRPPASPTASCQPSCYWNCRG